MYSDQKKNFKRLIDLAYQNKVCKVINPNNPQLFRILYQPVCLENQTFKKLIKASMIWQKLVHLASLDSQLIISTFKQCVNNPYIGPLYSIYKESLELQFQRKPKIDIFRCDYFLEQMTKNIKLIQYNNHSVSLAAISSLFQKASTQFYQKQKALIKNNSLQIIAKSIKQFFTQNQLNGVFCYVSQRNQSNIYDQIFTIEELKKKRIPIQLVYFDELDQLLNVDENRNLYIKDIKISLVYFRAGYAPVEHTQKTWKGKKKVHLSNAICIPWIGSQLAGQKRMQAELYKQKVLEKFLQQKDIKLLKQTFIQTWDFDGSQDPQYYTQMMDKVGQDNFILKPNAEGGSNNFFGKKAYDKFKSLSNQQRPQYILTKRIYPFICRHCCINSKDECLSCDCSSELSIYGCIFSDKNGNLKCNESDGFLIRTKPTNCDECGLILGNGALSALQIIQ